MPRTFIIKLTPKQHDVCRTLVRAPILDPFNFTFVTGSNPRFLIDAEGLPVLEKCLDTLDQLGHPKRTVNAVRQKVKTARSRRKTSLQRKCLRAR